MSLAESIPEPPSNAISKKEQLENLLQEIQTEARSVKSIIETIPNKIKPMDKGLSLFQVKNDCFITYLTGLAHLICSKLEGQSLVNNPVIPLLIQLRITLEKIKPIESNLKYRIDKLLANVSASAQRRTSDALSHKPNLAAFEASSEEEEDDDEDEDGEDTTMSASFTTDSHVTEKYRPPKQRSVPYLETPTLKKMSKNKIKELQEEFSEAPETVVDAPETLDETYLARQQFEEANFMRFNVSKKELQKLKKPKTMRNELQTFLENHSDSE